MAGRDDIEWAPALAREHVQNCRVFARREDLMQALAPRGGTCAEVGVETGYFSAQILQSTEPRRMHLIDLDLKQIRYDKYAIQPAIDRGVVVLHEGDSVRMMDKLDPGSLDWIYVDGGHHYDQVKADLAAAMRITKRDGLILCNDYTQFSPLEGTPYGVAKAVNEMCLESGFELIGFAFHGLGYYDVALRRRQ